MAFAMQLANKQASLDQCPHVTEEAKQALSAAAAPPMRKVAIGKNENKVEIGGETVLFRHEEKFHRPTGIAIKIRDDLPDDELKDKVEQINRLGFERIGEIIRVNLIAIEHSDTSPDEYAKRVEMTAENTNLPLILLCRDTAALKAALSLGATSHPLIYAATEENWEQMSTLAKEFSCPLAVEGPDLEQLASLTERINQAGVEELILAPTSGGMLEYLERLTLIRRLALEKTYRPLGYPVITFTDEEDPFQEVAQAANSILKYGSILVMQGMESWRILPPLTVRQHIYIDPQVPNAVEAKLYEIGEPGPDSPVLFTTNFSLTYFTVAGEVEDCKVPAYISVMDTEGLGVLNAYADDRLSGETVVEAVKEQGAMEKVNHGKLIIPGLVAVLRMKIQEEGGWEVIVGPEDAASIPRFLKQEWPKLRSAKLE
jgi:acetyl-CoA decarbonylase/synthase complex subunit gamma